MSHSLLVGTRKGAFHLRESSPGVWKIEGPHFLGAVINHWVLDPRDRRTMVMAAKPGHLGPTIQRSTDAGKTWTEATRPPAFAKVPEGQKGRTVKHTVWLTPGHPDRPGTWFAGTGPAGLFRSDDGGDTWDGVAGINDNPDRIKWTGPEEEGPPDIPSTHSINVDPRDPRHMYLGFSGGGVFESRDEGATWKPLNRGCAADFMPGGPHEYGHDPHCMRLHPLKPDRLYQQNHCGIYRMDRPNDEWIRIGNNMPKEIGDIGFPVVLHPRHPDTAWVFPMDGTSVWPRVSPGGKPAVYRTRDAGATWERQCAGLPPEQGWFTVKRQCFTSDARNPVHLYFGTTSGSIWESPDEGETWRCIAQHLPHVYSVEAAAGV